MFCINVLTSIIVALVRKVVINRIPVEIVLSEGFLAFGWLRLPLYRSTSALYNMFCSLIMTTENRTLPRLSSDFFDLEMTTEDYYPPLLSRESDPITLSGMIPTAPRTVSPYSRYNSSPGRDTSFRSSELRSGELPMPARAGNQYFLNPDLVSTLPSSNAYSLPALTSKPSTLYNSSSITKTTNRYSLHLFFRPSNSGPIQ